MLHGADGKYMTMGRRIDMQVLFPRYSKQEGRSDWLAALADRRALNVPDDLLPKEGRRLIKVVPKENGAHSVPTDIVLVEAGKRAPVFMLPSGDYGAYRYLVEDEALAP